MPGWNAFQNYIDPVCLTEDLYIAAAWNHVGPCKTYIVALTN